MMYLIGQMSVWLLLTAAAMAVAGWMFAAERAAPAERALRRDRDNLVRDLAKLASGESELSTVESEREADAMRRMAQVREARIAELEQNLAQARARAGDLSAELAERDRGRERDAAETDELTRLRAFAAAHQARAPGAIDAEATDVDPAEEENGQLQAWRLRYFEERVRYLENDARVPATAESADPAVAWRAREAEARAAELEEEVRRLTAAQQATSAPESDDAAPFAADAEVDAMLRWRLLYLERRVAHMQEHAAAEALAVAAPVAVAAAEPDRWKWRARYLEARVRHLEQRAPAPAPAVEAAPADDEPAPTPAPHRVLPVARGEKPPVISAPRNGAPDDFTLIEGVSALQQSTLNAMGVFHFDQIAAWTPEHVAWIDSYLLLDGRIDEEDWIEQAAELARELAHG